jgi:hypothetical protein
VRRMSGDTAIPAADVVFDGVRWGRRLVRRLQA